jgi:hypothetical protein
VQGEPHQVAADDHAHRPPPDRGSWLAWAVFLVGVAIVSGAAGYALNRVVTKPDPRPPAVTGPASASPSATPNAGATASTGVTGLTAEQVAIRLAGAGLPLRTTVVYTAANDPDNLLGRPGGYTSKIAFADPRIGRDRVAGTDTDAIERGGSIEVYPDVAAASARVDYLRTVSSASPRLAEYTYLQAGVVLRLSRHLTQDAAAGYEGTLKRLSA